MGVADCQMNDSNSESTKLKSTATNAKVHIMINQLDERGEALAIGKKNAATSDSENDKTLLLSLYELEYRLNQVIAMVKQRLQGTLPKDVQTIEATHVPVRTANSSVKIEIPQ